MAKDPMEVQIQKRAYVISNLMAEYDMDLYMAYDIAVSVEEYYKDFPSTPKQELVDAMRHVLSHRHGALFIR